MMAIQMLLGKAFEYSCLRSLYEELSENQEVVIVETRAFGIAGECFRRIEDANRQKMKLASNASVRLLMRLEPQLGNPVDNTPLYLSIQEDSEGIAGDVRDILTIRTQNAWEIGISCKHNHMAVKHSRLSPNINFGRSWFDVPCTQTYFNEINPIFEELTQLKDRGSRWRDLQRKPERFYVPVLTAFVNELRRLDAANPGVIPERLLHYLLGRNDFYKVITHDHRRTTQVQAFNIYGTLNRPSGNIRPETRVQQLVMPSRFFDIDFIPGSMNAIQIVCDNGWTVKLRIHSAKSEVEPSLKFDVSLVGVPQTLYTNHEAW